MLAAANRLGDASSFREVTRRGHRAASRSLVVHLLVSDASSDEPRAGLVVGRGVGNAVVRTRVKRRLRHLLRARIVDLPAGGTVVVRALAPASGASSATLGADLDRCLSRVLVPQGRSGS